MLLAGDRWNEQMSHKFDEMAKGTGTVPRSVVIEHAVTKSLMINNWSDLCASAVRLAEQETREPTAPLEDTSGINVPSDAALIRLQGLARSKNADLEMRRKAAQKINTSMELAAERKQNKLDLLMSNLHEKLPDLEKKESMHDALLDTIDKMRKTGWPLSLEVEEGYTGLHLPNPLTKDAMIELLDQLNEQARKDCKKKRAPTGVKNLLHVKYALQIAVGYMEIVRGLKPVVHVSTALAGKLTVVGDMHGQLRDLCEIFRHNGFPSFDNPYLFNGDLVDRGEYSAEICLLLMGFAVADPGSVLINRGNHEDMTVCTGYGFVDELVTKFSQNMNGRHMLAVIDTIFSLLPLAHVIDDNILVIHGGISDKFTLRSLQEINRRPYRTLTGLPTAITGRKGGSDKEGHSHETWAVLMDCLWSDPARPGERFPAGKECKPNDERGGGVMFSAAFSKKFLDEHKLGTIIRSHECQDRGFCAAHGGRVLTLFSASNYYGDDEQNDGAILVLSPHQKNQGRLYTYSTSYTGPGGYHKLNIATSVSKMEAAALGRVQIALLDHRRELVKRLKELDPENTGVIKSVEWANVMAETVPVKLPWLHLKLKFVDAAGPDCVNYTKMTDKLGDAFGGGEDEKATHRAESLYRMRGELQKLFRILDLDDSGVLDKTEFLKGCDLINSMSPEKLFEKSDVDDFMRQLDKNADGLISFQEFSDGLLAPASKDDD